jgi:hypothetical protein
MTYLEFSSKKENKKSVIRVVHNRENPFVQLNKQALWDQNLSLRATGLWARCMSRPDNWEFSMKELVEKCVEGQDAVFKAMKEILAAGYGMRIHYRLAEKGKYLEGGIHYIFFEFPATEKDKLDQLEFFKKSFQHRDFHDRGNHDCENPQLLIKILTEKEVHKEKETTTPTPPKESADAQAAKAADGEVAKKKFKKEFSPAVKEIGDKMLKILSEANPVYRPPDKLDKFLESIDFMLEKDRQNPELLLETFEWACRDNVQRGDFKGWQSVICTNKRKGKASNPAEIFRGHFSTIFAQRNSRADRKFAPSSKGNYENSELYKQWNDTAL